MLVRVCVRACAFVSDVAWHDRCTAFAFEHTSLTVGVLRRI